MPLPTPPPHALAKRPPNLEPATGGPDREQRLRNFLAAAHAVIAGKKSPLTRAAYTSDLERWVQFCRAGQFDPLRASLDDTARFRESQLLGARPVTVRRVLAALSAIYRPIVQSRLSEANPFHPSVLAWPAAPTEGSTPAVSEAHALAIIAVAERAGATRDVVILQLLRTTGLRRASVAGLRREHVQGPVLAVVVKGGKERQIELPVRVAAAVAVWRATLPAGPGPLFPSTDAHRPIHPTQINRLVELHMQAAGISGVSPHQFRVALITAGYDARLPEREIQQAAHHARPETTRRYDRAQRGGRVLKEIDETRERARGTDASD